MSGTVPGAPETRGHSLRARLLWFLLAAIVVTGLAQGVGAYRTALREADEIFDYHMQQMALSLRARLPAGVAPGALNDDEDDRSEDFIVQVWTPDGVRVWASGARSLLPERAVLGFSEVRANGSTYRVFSVQSRSQIVQVAQDLAVRRHMAGTLALRSVLPVAVMAPLLMLIVGWVVSRSLQPVARVREQLSARDAADLSPVSEAGLPEEVRPLVHELNALFGRVRQAFDTQRHFVADAAHELRSPLSALKLQAQALQRAPDAAGRELAAQRISAGIDRATRLMEQLLNLAREEASVASGARAVPTRLVDVARLALSDAATSAQLRRIDLGLHHADEDAVVDGHADALRMLLRNLLDNAVKYSPEGGRVDLSVHGGDGVAASLEVEDSGPGIDPEERGRVFDRFYRVPGTVATGSGLGLAIVRAVADQHGAQLSLDASPRLGGLRVRVAFTRAASMAGRG